MKTFKILLTICAMAAMALVSCSKDEEATPDTPETSGSAGVDSESSLFTADADGGSILFGAEGGSVTLNIDCDGDWNVTEDGTDWLSLGYGSTYVTVTAGQSTVESEQTATLTFTSAGASFATVHISQEAYTAPQLGVDGLSWHAPAVGELTVTIAIEANYEWEAVSSAEWLSAENTDGGLKLTAEENADYEERTAEVKVTCTDGVTADSQTVSVLQDARAYVNLGQTEIEADPYGATFTVEAESNYEMAFSCDASWITAELADGVLTLKVAANDSEDDREAAVAVTAGDGAENVAEATVTVSQVGNNLSAMVLEYTLTAAGRIYLPINGNVNCDISWGDGSSDEGVTSDYPSHTYSDAGAYTVTVSGSASGMNMYGVYGSSAGPDLLTGVRQWGNLGLTSMNYALYNSGVTSLPADTDGAFANVTTFEDAFYQCGSLTDVSEDLLKYASSATSFEYIFANCTALESVPDGLFDGCTAVTSFNYAFDGCTALKQLPANVFDGKSNLTSVSYMFRNCSSVTSLPSGFMDGLTGVTKLDYLFFNCSSLTSLPTGLLDKCTAATSFTYLFGGTGLTEDGIPSGLFDKNTAVTNMMGVFYMTKIKSVPEGLFAKNTAVTSFYRVFYGCEELTSIPADTFANNTAVTTFYQAFMKCTALAGADVPTDLFRYNTEVTTFQEVFSSTNFTECPKVFDYASKATNFYGAFEYCNCLTSAGIPEDLFVGATAATSFDFLFAYSTSLDTVPVGLFANNTAVTSLGAIFDGCTALTSIPEGLFDNNVNVTSFGSLCIDCTSLTSVPAGLFDKNTAVTSFYKVFNGCTALSGESPYTEINGTKVHLYQRSSYSSYFATPKTTTGCFTGCTKLSDYSSIPSTWK